MSALLGVSGVIAGFLSRRPEFIGRPGEVKAPPRCAASTSWT